MSDDDFDDRVNDDRANDSGDLDDRGTNGTYFDDRGLDGADFDDEGESFGGRKDRRRPKGARHRKELLSESSADANSPFTDAGLRALHARGTLTELGRQVRGGKEATVYRAAGTEGPLAAKVYSDSEVRSFQADNAYLVGRHVSDRRIRKMLGDAKRRGLSPELAHWVFHEYRMLWKLNEAGFPVPRPAVGPDPAEMVEAGRVVLMDWVGDEEPAPRLADVQLEPSEAEAAWQQACELLIELLKLGLVHGDLSTFNLLWWQRKLVLIDLPQVVEIDRNKHAGDLLDRDARSLCSSFRSFGIDQDPAQLLLRARQAAGYPPSGRLSH
ncbi:MAG: RIO1 family regulatory kinase/ATPase [Trueperaceae bacterium]